jgi:hypothetical protein
VVKYVPLLDTSHVRPSPTLTGRGHYQPN